MKVYQNGIYPISLVLSDDTESVDKYYYNPVDGEGKALVVSDTAEATTMPLSRRESGSMAVGIFFNVEITPKLAAHEAFHATYFMMERLGITLSDYSDEAWAYLIGWVVECIFEYKKEME